jgi:hypothetical protein
MTCFADAGKHLARQRTLFGPPINRITITSSKRRDERKKRSRNNPRQNERQHHLKNTVCARPAKRGPGSHEVRSKLINVASR